jgi:hypothetical protein
MSLYITSKTFKPVNWAQGSGTNYQNGCIMDKYTMTLEFYYQKAALNKRFRFYSTSKKIVNYNNIDFYSFIDSGFQVGETIEIPESASNNGTLTITEVTERYLVVNEALVDETLNLGNLYVTTKIQALDFFYNIRNVGIVERRQPLTQAWGPNHPARITNTFGSLTDDGVEQRYTIDGIDCEDDTVKYFHIGSDSHAWVTDVITEIDQSQCYIQGQDLVGYKQKFKIVHTYFITPYYLKAHFQNMQTGKAADYLLAPNKLSYTLRLEPRYNANTSEPAVSYISELNDGRTAWFDNNFLNTRAGYYISSVVFKDEDNNVIDSIDFRNITSVTIRVKTLIEEFVDDETTGSKFILNHLYCPNDVTAYQDTSTTLTKNYLADRQERRTGQAAANGVAYGTDYQCITDYSVEYINPVTCDLTFKIEYSAYIKDLLAAKSDDDRYFSFIVTTEKAGLTESEGSDRVAMRAGFWNMINNTKNNTLLKLITGQKYIHAYQEPESDTAFNNVKGYEGTRWFAELPFHLNYADIIPKLRSAKFEVVATKSGKDDYVIEGREFNTLDADLLDDIQQIDMSTSRGYKLPEDSLFNQIFLRRDSSLDDTDLYGFVFHYAFVLRDESWTTLDNIVKGTDFQKEHRELTNRWAAFNSDWTLKLRFTAEVDDENGDTTQYRCETTITILETGEAADQGPVFNTQTILLDEDGNIVDSIIKGGTTKIVSVFLPENKSVTLNPEESTVDTQTHYEFTLEHAGIVSGSLSFPDYEAFVHPGETFTDNNDGTLTGDMGGTGTINYATGSVVLDYNSAPGFPCQIKATYDYNPLADVVPEALIGSLWVDMKTSNGGITRRLSVSTDEETENDQFEAPEADSGAVSSWATNGLRIDVFSNSVMLSTLYTERDDNFGTDPCAETTTNSGGFGGVIVIGTVLNIPSPTGTGLRLLPDLSVHLWSNGNPSDF